MSDKGNDLDHIRELRAFRQLGSDLRELAEAEDRRTSRRRWWRAHPFVIGAATAVLVAAPAGAAIGGLWSPDVGPSAPEPTVTAAPSSATPCVTAQSDTSDVPPASATQAFGVLRKPQTDDDRAVLSLPGFKHVDGAVARKYVRLLGIDADGHRQWLVPVASSSPTAGCSSRAGWALSIVSADTVLGSTPVAEAVSHGAISSRDEGVVGDHTTVTGLVPDGVSSVTARYPRDAGPPRTWPVKSNLFSFDVHLPADVAMNATLTWNRTHSGR